MAFRTPNPRARPFSTSLAAGAGNAPAQRLDLQDNSTAAQPANALPRDDHHRNEDIYAIMNSERNRRSMSPVVFGYVEDVFNEPPPATERTIAISQLAPAVEDTTSGNRNSRPHALLTPPEDHTRSGDVAVVSHIAGGHAQAPFNAAGQPQATAQPGNHAQTHQPTIQPHGPSQTNPASPNVIHDDYQLDGLCYPDSRSPSPPAGFMAARNAPRPLLCVDKKGSPISRKQIGPPKTLYLPSLSGPTGKTSASSRTLTNILDTSRRDTTYQFPTYIDVRQGVSRFIPSLPMSESSPTNRNIALTAGHHDNELNVTIGRKRQNAPLARQQPVLLARLPASKISPLKTLASGQAMSYSRVGRVDRTHQAIGVNQSAQNKGTAHQGNGNAKETRHAGMLPNFLAKYEPTQVYTADPPPDFQGTRIEWLEAVYKCLCNEKEALIQMAKHTKESLYVQNRGPPRDTRQQEARHESFAPAQCYIRPQAPAPRAVVPGHQEYSPPATPTPHRPCFRLAPAKFTPHATILNGENRAPAIATQNAILAPITPSRGVAASSLPSLNALGLLLNAEPKTPQGSEDDQDSDRENVENNQPAGRGEECLGDSPASGRRSSAHNFHRLFSDSPISDSPVQRRSRSRDDNSQSEENRRPRTPHGSEDGQDSDRENDENNPPRGHTEEYRGRSPAWGSRSPVYDCGAPYSGSPINYSPVRRRSRSSNRNPQSGGNRMPTPQGGEDGQDSDRENDENNPPRRHTEEYRGRSSDRGRRSPVYDCGAPYSGSPINYSPVRRRSRSSDENSQSEENRRLRTPQGHEDGQESDRENDENNAPRGHTEEYRGRSPDRGRRSPDHYFRRLYGDSPINYSPVRRRSRSSDEHSQSGENRRPSPQSSQDGQDSDRENVEPRHDERHSQGHSSDDSGSSQFSPVSDSFVAVEWSPIWNNGRDAECKRGRTDDEDEERRSSDGDDSAPWSDDNQHTPKRPRFGVPSSSRRHFETVPCTPEPVEQRARQIDGEASRQPRLSGQGTSLEARWVGEDQRRAELGGQMEIIARMVVAARNAQARSALSSPFRESASTSTARLPRPQPEVEVKEEKRIVPIPREALRRFRAQSQAPAVNPEPRLRSGVPLGVGEHREFDMATYECHESASQAGSPVPSVRQTRARTRAQAAQAKAQVDAATKQRKSRVAKKVLPIPRNIRARSRTAADGDERPGGSGLSNEEKEVIADKRTRNARRK